MGRSQVGEVRSLGKYALVREVGRGGMGVVYLAEDTTLHRQVAVKVLHEYLASDEGALMRLQEEARAIARLHHPNIIHINSLQDCGRFFAIDMEYVDGASLGAHMTGDGVAAVQAVALTAEVLEGLAVCHDLGMVHRDIKPNNVLVGRDGSVKLTDFGLATAFHVHLESSFHGATSTGFFVGTPRYAPPEAWEGGQPQPTWDVYSVGAMLYEMLAGRPLYQGASPLEVIRQIARPVRPLEGLPPDLSRELSSLLHRLLESAPEHRPPHARAVLEELAALPEYKNREDSQPTLRAPRSSVPVVHAAIPRLRRGAVVGRVPWRVALLVLALVAMAGAVLYTVLGAAPAAVDDAPGGPRGPMFDAGGLYSVAELLAPVLPADSRTGLVLEGLVMEADGADRVRALLKEGPDGGLRFQGYSGDTLLALHGTPLSGGLLEFQGGWARYGNPAGLSLRYGTLDGTGQWAADRRVLTASLLFTDARENRSWSRTLTAGPREGGDSPVRLAYELEELPNAQMLLYRELLPRRLGWAAEMERLFPAVPGARVAVPMLAEAGGVEVDGRLEEALWQPMSAPDTGTLGEAVGRPHSAGATIRFRSGQDAVYLGLRGTAPPARDAWIRLGLLPGLPAPPMATAQCRVRIRSEGSAEGECLVDGRPVPWDCDWEGAIDVHGGVWTAEVRIPLDSFRPEFRPAPGHIWRMNVSVEALGSDGVVETAWQWGCPEPGNVRHGLLLEFAEVTP